MRQGLLRSVANGRTENVPARKDSAGPGQGEDRLPVEKGNPQPLNEVPGEQGTPLLAA